MRSSLSNTGVWAREPAVALGPLLPPGGPLQSRYLSQFLTVPWGVAPALSVFLAPSYESQSDFLCMSIEVGLWLS